MKSHIIRFKMHQKTRSAHKNHLFKIHHKIKLQLDAICQEAGDMNVEEFMQVYESLKPTPMSGIDRNFQEDMINDMDMGQDY